jgi:hypothetical protein
MAITPAALQTALGTNAMNAVVVRADEVIAGGLQRWYVVGNANAPGRNRWVTTTAADNAATQAAAVLTALRA